MRYVLIPIYARNVLFSKSSEKIFNTLIKLAKSEEVKKYIENNLRNYLINSYPTKEIHREYNSKKDPKWVEKALDRKETIYDVDLSREDFNKYKDFIKFLNSVPNQENIYKISVPDLEEKTKQYNIQLEKHAALSDPSNVKEVHLYPNGYKWVRLISKQALNREGELMNNCLRRGSGFTISNGSKVYSLRDENNKPHIDIEVSKDKVIYQIKANSNKPVNEDSNYFPYIIDFINKKYVKVEDVLQQEAIKNKFFYIDGKAISFSKMKEKDNVFNGDLNLRFIDSDVKIPNDFTINGNLNLELALIHALPEGLKVKGTLYLESSNIKSLPSDLECNEVSLAGTSISSLPNKLPNIKKLIVDDCRLSSFPLKGGFEMEKGTLEIRKGCRVTQLPKGLKLGGDLIISSPRITSIPKDAEIKGQLYLDGSSINISMLPENLKEKVQ